MLPVTWIESNPHLIEALEQNVMQLPCQVVIEATLWCQSNLKKELKVTNNSFSSSLLSFKAGTYLYPEISITSSVEVLTSSIDDLNISQDTINGGLLVLDLQGVELEVLKCAVKTLGKFNYILCEVSIVEMYSNQPLWLEISEFLKSYNFNLIDFQIDESKGWGNALYRRGRVRILDAFVIRRRRLARAGFTQKIHNVSKI